MLEDLDPPEQQAILGALEVSERAVIEQALTYPEYSAGRLMQRELVIAPEYWTVGHAIDHMRGSDTLPDTFYHVIIVDPRLHPVGQVALGAIMGAPRDRLLTALVEPQFRTIPVDQYDGDVAYAFNQYHLISAPVVDMNGRLVGVITIDDAMAVLDEEHEEDILRLAGVGDDSRLSDTVLETVRLRLPWLAINLGTAALAAAVIDQFAATISALVVLAALMPIVASMGGNAGTQSLTIAVRALATRDLTAANAWRVVRREMAVGLLNGLVLALPLGVLTGLLFGMPLLGAVIAAALVINLFVAALAGVTVPLVMDRAGIDPALASGVFVTTVTDVIGFMAFLGLATLVLL
jgi:magnesium transporter